MLGFLLLFSIDFLLSLFSLQLAYCMADLLNRAFNSGSIFKNLRDDVVEARQKIEVAEPASKCSKEDLSKVKAKLAKAKADWTQERERVELDLVKTKKEAIKVVEKFRAFESFAIEKAKVVVDFQKLEEFYNLYRDFGQESYQESFNGGSQSAKRPSWIISQEQSLIAWMWRKSLNASISMLLSKPLQLSLSLSIPLPSSNLPTDLATTDSTLAHLAFAIELASIDPSIGAKPSSSIIDPNKEVGNLNYVFLFFIL